MAVRLAIVASSFNADIVDAMVDRARRRATKVGARVTHVVRVPGTFEIPLGLHRLLRRKDVDAAVALGAVIQGETDHDDLIARAVAGKLLDLETEFGKPIGLGITGPGMTRAQAEARIDAADRAVDAAVGMVTGKILPASGHGGPRES